MEDSAMHDFQWRASFLASVILFGSMSGRLVAEQLQDDSGDKVASVTDDQDPQKLSVAPLDHIVYPESRPGWISDPVKQQGDEVTFVVVSGPCETSEESKREVKLMLRATLSTFIQNVTGSFGMDDFYQISDQRIDKDLTQRHYSGELMVGGNAQYEDAVEIRISKVERDRILNAWKNIEVVQRVKKLGVVAFGGFITLVVSSSAFGVAVRRRERKQSSPGDSV
jgi:hypothetical protein